MTVEVTETMDQTELLGQFRTRYEALVNENRDLQKKIRDNEATALKLMGAIETLEYLNKPEDQPEETTEEAGE